MFLKFKPDFYVCSLQEIPVVRLKNKGIQGLIIDLDNTLTEWNCQQIEPAVYQWLQDLQQIGFKICIVSNNGIRRTEATLEGLKIPFVAKAFKPRKKGLLRAIALMDCQIKNTAIIGDQLFTDILAGKRTGILTVLVAPRSSKEFFGTKFTRIIERQVLKRIQGQS